MRKRGIVLFTAITALIVTLLVIQVWLLSAALDALLAEREGMLAPAAIASALIATVNLGLLAYALGFDRRARALTRDA
jgi:uncharacterized protein DUF6755